MKLFLLLAALVASASAAAVKPADKSQIQVSMYREYYKAPESNQAAAPRDKREDDVLAAVEYFKAPESCQVRSAAIEHKREDDVLAAVEYFKAPEPSQDRAAVANQKRKDDVLAPVDYFNSPELSQVRAAAPRDKREDDVLAAVEYLKAPELSQVRAAAPRDKREVDEIAGIGFNPPKKDDRRPRRAATQIDEPIVTYMPARTIVPMATYTAAAKTVEEKEQMRKNVAAWRQYKDEMHNALHYCQIRQNVSVAVSDQLMNLEMENVGRKEHCYVYCVLERLGKYKPGGVQMDKMRQSVGPFVGMERLNKILDKCQAVTAPSVCESGYKFFECYRQNMFDMRKAEDKPTDTYVWMVQQ